MNNVTSNISKLRESRIPDKKIFGRLYNVSVGDSIYVYNTDRTISKGDYHKVTRITSTYIECGKLKFDNIMGNDVNQPSEYYIAWWEKK